MDSKYYEKRKSNKDFTVNYSKLLANIDSIVLKYKDLPRNFKPKVRRKELSKVVDVINHFCTISKLEDASFVSVKGLRNLVETTKKDSARPIVMRYLHLIESTLSGQLIEWNNELDSESIHTLQNTIWDVYFVKNNEGSLSQSKDFLALAVYILKFENDGKTVRLISDKRNYKGKYSVGSDIGSIIKIQLREENVEKSETPNQREITLLYSYSEASLIEGFMVTYTSDIIYNNAVLFTKNNSVTKLPAKSVAYQIYSEEYYKIDTKIRSYFDNVVLNRNRTGSGGIRNRQGFEALIKAKNKINLPFKYDLYISAPITSLKNERQFLITQMLILGMLKKLKKNNLFKDSSKIYSPATLVSKEGELQTWTQAKKALQTNRRYEEALQKWKQSKYYMLIMPFDVPSVAMIQASWVFFNPESEIKKSVFLISDSIPITAFMEDKHKPKQALYHPLHHKSLEDIESSSEDNMDSMTENFLSKIQGPEMLDICSVYDFTGDSNDIEW